MDWNLDNSKPICAQLCEKICVAIASGEYRAGEKLPSVREVALLASVTPNTVQKTFNELETHGVIHAMPCSGWYVNEDISVATRELEALRRKKGETYLEAMRILGCTAEEALENLNTILQKRKEHHE